MMKFQAEAKGKGSPEKKVTFEKREQVFVLKFLSSVDYY